MGRAKGDHARHVGGARPELRDAQSWARWQAEQAAKAVKRDQAQEQAQKRGSKT